MRLVVVCLAICAVVPDLRGQPFPFVRIADSSTIMPGTGAQFQQFNRPAAGNGVVSFAGHRITAPVFAGMYSGSGGPLSVLADSTTPIPGGNGNFTAFARIEFWPPALSGSDTAFVGDGAGTSFIQRGIYMHSGAALTKVVDRNTLIPKAGGAPFRSILPPSLDQGRICFVGGPTFGSTAGVYRWQSGALSVVADMTTPIPAGSGTFTQFGADSCWDGDSVVFTGSGQDSFRGMYRAEPGGQLVRLYDSTTSIPGGSGTFLTLSQSSASNGHVAFRGQGVDQVGIYTDLGGSLTFAAHMGTPVPERPGVFFDAFGSLDLSGDVLAFTGNFGANRGVYLYQNGALSKVAAQGDFLDGRTILDVAIGMQGLDGTTLAMWVEFTNGSTGIYMATIPAPASLSLLAVGVLAFRGRRR